MNKLFKQLKQICGKIFILKTAFLLGEDDFLIMSWWSLEDWRLLCDSSSQRMTQIKENKVRMHIARVGFAPKAAL